jgi:pilus assembly protein CpaD
MRRITTTSLLALGFGLAACGPVNRSLDSVHQPIVSRSDYVLDVSIDHSGSLASGEGRRLDGWFDSIKLGYGDKIAIDDPAGSSSYTARNQVAQIAARHGLLMSSVPPIATEGVPFGALRVVVSRSSAGVPHCPDWDRISQPEFAGSAMSNYGCAVNTNLAAMVADPGDLVRGQIDEESGDAQTASRALKAYRDAEPTGKKGLTAESTKSGGN